MTKGNDLKIVVGAHNVGNPADSYGKQGSDFSTDEGSTKAFQALEKLGVKDLDSAQQYGNSEVGLGRLDIRKDFVISSKWPGGFNPGHLTKDEILTSARASVKDRLKIDHVDIFYIHAPDPTSDPEDVLAGVDAAHKEGLFKRFGLSNFVVEDVVKYYDLAKARGFVLPTVYQGQYSPVTRLQETVLFPTLRKLGISFYAYSPVAGGFLTKTKEEVTAGEGRFSQTRIGSVWNDIFNKPVLLDNLAVWAKAAEQEGVSKAELAYRWVAHHSALDPDHGDAIIISGRNIEQLTDTIEGIRKGPLTDAALKSIDAFWENVKDDAPLDSYNSRPKPQLTGIDLFGKNKA